MTAIDSETIDTEVEVDWPAYKSTQLRCPRRPLVVLPERFRDLAGPVSSVLARGSWIRSRRGARSRVDL